MEPMLENTLQWYVLRVTYQRELIAKAFFDEKSIESFVPTKKVYRINSAGRRVAREQAILHNYIFVRSTREVIDHIKSFELPYLRYVMHVQNDERRVMVVPEEQMRSFVAIAGSDDEQVMFLTPESVDLSKGDRVRIVAGVFEGAEGVLVKVSGVRNRRVVVKIEGVAAVAAPLLPIQMVERI
jgi:transcription antitermination factor NusG